MILIAVIIAVAVTVSKRNSSSGSSNSATGNSDERPPAPPDPTASRIPSDYTNNHPLSAADGGIDVSGEYPKYGKKVKDHFVIHSPRMLGLTRLDPIVSPGEVSQHAHRFHGASYVTPNLLTSSELLEKANCSTVQVQDDKSQYWLPQLYVRLANGTNIAAGIRQASTYYFMKAPSRERIWPFPDNYNMIAGDPYRRYKSAEDIPNVRWNCYQGQGNGLGADGFPASACHDGLVAIIIL